MLRSKLYSGGYNWLLNKTSLRTSIESYCQIDASKTGIGKYTYDTGKKNAVVQVENTGNLIQGAASLTYNAFNKVATVVQGTNTLTITYGPDRQRTKTVLVNGSNTTTTLYTDNYEQRTVNGTITCYHYVSSPDGLAAVYVKNATGTTAYYIETDHLGNIIRAYDYVGNTKFSASYDAWGNQTISVNAIGLTCGYTGHEHWPQFGLIDMNGRFYDPLIGRFLSPDPYLQNPDNPQNFNRYSYCLNNPLKYTDPTGNKGVFASLVGIYSTVSTNSLFGSLLATYLSPNANVFYELQKIVSPIAIKLPSLCFGSLQNGLGFDISVGIPKGLGLGYRFHWGATYYISSYCDYSGWETRKGREVELGVPFFCYSGTEFKSGETSQATYLFTYGGPFGTLKYENDMRIDWLSDITGMPEGGGDKYRTAAVQIDFGLVYYGLNLCTGDYVKDSYEDNITPNTYKADYEKDGSYVDPNKYRAGVLYIGIGSFRIGRNSENIRDFFQNGLHRWIDDPLFKKLDIAPQWFWYFGSGSGNTLW